MSDSNLTEAQREQVARAKQAAEELAAEKSDIPDALKPLVETHEEDGSPVAVCDPGCGKTFRFGVLWRIKLRGKPAELGIMRGVCWCAYCGTIVGEDECGRPYRIRLSRVVEALEQAQAERDHYKRALEWACDRLGEEALTCPDAPFDGCHAPDDYDCAGHWREAALAATKEATNGPADA